LSNVSGTILVGEDDLEVREYLELALTRQGYCVELAQNNDEVLAYLQSGAQPVAAVVLDPIMLRREGADALREIRKHSGGAPVIMVSGAAPPQNVEEAIKNGATDFVTKPVNPEDLRRALKAALDKTAPPEHPVTRPSGQNSTPVFYGSSPAMLELRRLIAQIGWSETPVLMRGETGAGKEVFARELHALSPRAARPMLKLNCAALPSELVESELFGYERGAFTGAFQRTSGMFERTDGGTILLDEIGDMDFRLQAKLLQVLQDQTFHRLGGREMVRVDVRIIAATHRDLERGIAEHTFREDLYYRLNVINVRVPPLRERREDILALADFLIRKHGCAIQPPDGIPGALPQLPASLQNAFLSYHWPGNIRELENLVRKLLVLRDPELIRRDLLSRMSAPAASGAPPAAPSAAAASTEPASAVISIDAGYRRQGGPETVLQQVARQKQEAERAAITTALTSVNWNRRRAAAMLQIDYKALLYRMKKLGIEKEKPPLAQAALAGSGDENRA
jgi:two-component system, NtrC family, response regulator AtoC